MARSFVILLFPSLTYAYTTFETNCSIPTNSTNFVSSNGTRGTMDILWSCLFTIITCTWIVQHLNVPEQREDRNPGIWGTIWWAIKRGWTSAKWMLVTVLAPEILLAKNVGDLTTVKLDLEKLQDWAAQDGVPWTRTHSLFANMGGFVIRRSSPKRAQNPTESKEPSTAELGLSANASQPVLIHLLTQDIVLLRSKGLLPKLPYITLEEINDKSKSDSLIRAIIVVQIIWMVIQIIARAFRSLAISQLEVSVVAFATCAIILYGINWEKPKGVQVPITIISYPGPFPKDTMEIVERDRNGADISVFSGLMFLVEKLFTCLYDGESTVKWPLGKPIPNVYNRDDPWVNRIMGESVLSQSDIFGLFLGTAVFGAVHIAAWNFVFPTPVESLLWKIAAILCTTMGLVFGGYMVTLSTFSDIESLGYIYKIALAILFFLIPASYVVCRLFLVVEIFRSLCFLPPSAYIATWATNVPHVA
ncbi:uncharacterized protein LY89DRAFT_707347 [Mollisia scopiformis]|uniref:Uncharacterized protein n=1 Tax=Mollisia scopiformis TaxID=149040 RepID=A0A194X9U3_MOLSC|nr:uncharacterized protein LY89DRAFT_707347 [Mollisia scopiformis]KUJ16938.1 hypothetical protein LY89DRAFT_707347 [Mollisia scopiformis]